MAKVKIEGLEKLQKKLKENVSMDDVKTVVKQNTLRLQREAVKNAGENTFNKGYFTGNIKQNIASQGMKISDGGLTGKVGTTAEYGPYLENGTRFMEAEPFIKPSIDTVGPQFKADMNKLTR